MSISIYLTNLIYKWCQIIIQCIIENEKKRESIVKEDD